MSHTTTLSVIPFDATSTASDVLAGVDLTGRRAIVTGATSGIGLETARALALAGAEVTLAVRDVTAGHRVAADLQRATGRDDVRVGALDLADQYSVAAFVRSWDGPLHILVNNAGVMAPPLSRTPEGWERQFATNHLGHFSLATGLHPSMAGTGNTRVVSVSSVGHLNGDIRWDDLHFERGPYDPWAAYSQSKTANVLFAVGAAARWADDGITVNALTPGRIRTALLRHIGDETAPGLPAAFEPTSPAVTWKSVPQGAATSVLLAGSPLVDGVSGRYYEDCQEAELAQPGVRRGVAPYAVDPDAAARLWSISLRLIRGKA
ncbi:SDR family NAD(P)-dependent oxidoreductase [Cellulomonas hominis]